VQKVAHFSQDLEGTVTVLLQEEGHDALVGEGLEKDCLTALDRVYLVKEAL